MPVERRSQMAQQGLVRLRGVFSRAEAAAMQDCVWAELKRRHGVTRDDPEGWDLSAVAGLQALRSRPVFAPIGGAALHAALDDLLGPGRWEVPKHWGQFLVSFPDRTGVPRSRAVWHTDFPYGLPPDRLVGALVISFLGEVPGGGGGTLALAGSHRLVARFLEARPHLRTARMKGTRRALLDSDPWLRALRCEWTLEDWASARVGRETRIGDVALRVVELTGEPGDVVLGHPWLLHTPAPNRGERPRLMRVQRIRATPADPPRPHG